MKYNCIQNVQKKISFAMRFYHQILSICTKSHILLFAFNREEIPKKKQRDKYYDKLYSTATVHYSQWWYAIFHYIWLNGCSLYDLFSWETLRLFSKNSFSRKKIIKTFKCSIQFWIANEIRWRQNESSNKQFYFVISMKHSKKKKNVTENILEIINGTSSQFFLKSQTHDANDWLLMI